MAYDSRYIITEIREREDNEFIFDASDRVVDSEEFTRLLNFFRGRGWDIRRIDERSLPKDLHHNNSAGYRITKKKEELFEDEELEN